MKDTLPILEKYTSQSCAEETFAEIYHWTFTYLKENEMRKIVDLDVSPLPLSLSNTRMLIFQTAITVLQVLFVNRENTHIGPFLEFLKDAKLQGHVKCLNKDQWDVFYEFSRSMDDVFTGYSNTAAWPSLFDDYVEWRRKQIGLELVMRFC